MKGLTYSIWAIALTTLVAASCAKVQEYSIPMEEEPPVEMVTFTFTAEKAGDETKTQAIIDTENSKVYYEWVDEDENHITVYLVEGKKLTKVTSTATKVDATHMKITATVPKADTYTFRAILAREFYAAGKPMVSKYQSPETDNFDPNGDILFSDDKVITTDGTSTGDMLLSFNRKVTVNKMTIKALGDGELVSKVEIISDKDLVGYYDGSSTTAVSDSKTLILTYNNEVVPLSGEFPVYFTCIPNDGHTLTVNVTTNVKSYSKTFGAGGIDFNEGDFLDFRVTMPEGITFTWNLVTSSSTALAANDVIVIVNNDADYALGSQNGTTFRNAVSVTSSDDKSVISSIPAGVQQITLETATDGWYLPVGSKYLYANGGTSNNYLYENTKAAAGSKGIWTISIDGDGVASIISQGSTDADARIDMRYNYNSGTDPRFSCYKTSSTLPAVRVYRKTFKDVTVWNLESLAVTTTPTKTTYTAGESFDVTGMVVKATFKDNAGVKSDQVVTLENSDLTISPTVLSAGETKATLTYLNKTVDVTGLTVNPINYAAMQESTLTVSGGMASVNVTINSTNYSGKKIASGGTCTVTVPAGSTKLYIHAAAWNGKTVSLEVTPNAKVSGSNSVSLTADSAIQGSGLTFNLNGQSLVTTDYFKTFTLTGVTTDTEFTLTSSGERSVVWGVHAE